MENAERSVSFVQPKSFKVVADHGEKVFYILILLGIFFTYQDLKGQFLIDVVIIVGILLTLLYIAK